MGTALVVASLVAYGLLMVACYLADEKNGYAAKLKAARAAVDEWKAKSAEQVNEIARLTAELATGDASARNLATAAVKSAADRDAVRKDLADLRAALRRLADGLPAGEPTKPASWTRGYVEPMVSFYPGLTHTGHTSLAR